MSEIGSLEIRFKVFGFTIEQNEDGALSVYIYFSMFDNSPIKTLIYPNAEFKAGSKTPWEIHQAVQQMREFYGCE